MTSPDDITRINLLRAAQGERRKRQGTVLNRSTYHWAKVNPMRATDFPPRTAAQQAEDIITGRAGVPQKSTITASSNGRTPDFDSGNAGSNPDAVAKRKGRPPGSKNVHSSTITPKEIKAIRLANGWLSQEEFGQLLGGIRAITVSKWETGIIRPSMQAEKLMRDLGKLLLNRNE